MLEDVDGVIVFQDSEVNLDVVGFSLRHRFHFDAQNLQISVLCICFFLLFNQHRWFVFWNNLAVDFLKHILFALRLLVNKLEQRFVLFLRQALLDFRCSGVTFFLFCLVF